MACGFGLSLYDLQILMGAEFSQKKPSGNISGTSQQWNHPSRLIQAAQKIGYEAKGFEAELEAFGRTWRRLQSPCGSGIQTESITFGLFLAWPMEALGKRSGSW